MSEEITGKDFGLKTVHGRLLKVIEVAKFLRVSKRWVHKHMENGTFPIPWFLIGERDRVVDSADLDTYLFRTRIEAGTAPLPLKAERKIKEEANM